MQVNSLQTSLTQAVASNRPVIIQGMSPTEAPRPVIEPDAVTALSFDDTADRSSQNLQLRLETRLEYEQNTRGHQGAIAQYLQTQHAAKREEIQQMVGVDIYA